VRGPVDHLTFEDDLSAVQAALAACRAAGRGWVNLFPSVEIEGGGGDAGLFTGRGPALPLATWTPGGQRRRYPASATLGLQHGTGPRVAAHLAELGLGVPAGWVVVQDHPRRGLVVEVPLGVDDRVVLDWLLAATSALCPVPFSSWAATVHP
jgi:hypothetical protein